jgi:hypothetical protein
MKMVARTGQERHALRLAEVMEGTDSLQRHRTAKPQPKRTRRGIEEAFGCKEKAGDATAASIVERASSPVLLPLPVSVLSGSARAQSKSNGRGGPFYIVIVQATSLSLICLLQGSDIEFIHFEALLS